MYSGTPHGLLLPSLTVIANRLINEFNNIPASRHLLLRQLTDYVSKRKASNQPVNLNFICTHNSRRSHLSQIWAQTAAHYYGIPNVHCFSGGTEATAFNPRAVKAMQDAGFDISVSKEGSNPVYAVRFSNDAAPLTVFSKRYDDEVNPKDEFAAVMTCSDADENCPFIPGAQQRIALTYNDPKEFDGTPQEALKYAERVYEIGREILYAFSLVK